jgi:hypothetical protein
MPLYHMTLGKRGISGIELGRRRATHIAAVTRSWRIEMPR